MSQDSDSYSNWRPLRLRCPCKHNHHDEPANWRYRQKEDWAHAECGEAVQMNEDAIVRCAPCETSAPFIDWRFNCRKHAAKEYKEVEKQYLVAALFKVIKSLDEELDGDDIEFYSNFVGAISLQC